MRSTHERKLKKVASAVFILDSYLKHKIKSQNHLRVRAQ